MCAQYVARDDTMLLCMLNIRKYVARDDDAVRNMYSYIYAQYVARDIHHCATMHATMCMPRVTRTRDENTIRLDLRICTVLYL